MDLFLLKFLINVMTLFDIVNFPFLDSAVPRRASYGVYLLQLIRFARVRNHVADFNALNKCLTNFSSRAIGIINFENHILNFIADTIRFDFQI